MDFSISKREGTIFPILVAISFAHLLNDMMQSVIPSIYPIIKDEYGLTYIQIGIITLVFQMTSSILQPLVGLYSDRHPHPFSLSTGMLFTFAGIIIAVAGQQFRADYTGRGRRGPRVVDISPRIVAHRPDGRRRQQRAGTVNLPGRGQRRQCRRAIISRAGHTAIRPRVP